jgi:leader peptidase (prepilin peptidase) / N-methyltransferase
MQYPLVEALTGVLFALIAGGLGVRWEFAGAVEIIELVLTGVLAATFVAIAVYDARHTIIPDAWVYAAALLALALALLTSYAPLHTTLLSGPAAALPLFALWLISAGRWMGLGDAKLALAIGWMLGPLYGVVAIFLAFVVGAVISVGILMPLPYLRSMLQKTGIARWHAAGMSFTMKSEVAFGPFLVAAFFIVWLALLYELPLPL